MDEKPEKHIASVAVINHAGQVLLQLRDGNTTTNPHKWGLPGGHVEPGEDTLSAARRELREETELVVADLRLYWQGTEEREDVVVHYSVYFSVTNVSDADVTCHEGAAMRFIAPEEVLHLELVPRHKIALRELLNSRHYRQVREEFVRS